ncbi:MAG: SHOCT-like domain-containing protein [Anaerolineae bacterium]
MATTEERLRILQLIEDGKITAEEGAKLIAALGQASPDSPGRADAGSRRSLRVVVTDTYSGKPKVNVKIPAGIVEMALRIGVHFIPDTDSLDLDQVTEALRAGVTGKVVDVMDEEGGERVEIFID